MVADLAEVTDLAENAGSQVGSQDISGAHPCWDSEQVKKIVTKDGGETHFGTLFGVIVVIVSSSVIAILCPLLVPSGGMFFVMAGGPVLGLVQIAVLVGNKLALKQRGKRYERKRRQQWKIAADMGR